jgi:AbrB family looped-hinge helix DNA binding protein
MKTRAIVSEKGQVTIPKGLRAKLGLVAGTVLSFEERQGKLVSARTPRSAPTASWPAIAASIAGASPASP